ncbi:phosphocarrier protein [Amycolatopsis pretoriensis]|uniref:Phosphocarrier protein n=1 Tax=Amycolatopsis pretoriensis TaxID=218821 RepID=A0A1H5Q634_9PSEU|nr:HPr family phosphocarrier protein [Amycolatopsis pretoriensis]SEF21485.1 phosphocarrier protein [Amycolatopsis pretoriensis]
MYQRRTLVASSVGLHARPAGLVARTAAEQAVKVRIAKITGGVAGDPVDAASVLGLMTLGAAFGDEVELTAEGDHAQASVDALAELIARDLDA